MKATLMKLPPNVQAVGLPWYELGDYARIQAVMEDGHLLPGTHAAWQAKAEQIERQLRGQGHLTVRAHLRPDQFTAWCRARGLDINAKARTQFAAWVAAQQHGTTD